LVVYSDNEDRDDDDDDDDDDDVDVVVVVVVVVAAGDNEDRDAADCNAEWNGAESLHALALQRRLRHVRLQSFYVDQLNISTTRDFCPTWLKQTPRHRSKEKVFISHPLEGDLVLFTT